MKATRLSAFGGRYAYVDGEPVLKQPEMMVFDAENPGPFVVQKAAEARRLLGAAKLKADMSTEFYLDSSVSMAAAVIWVEVGPDIRIGLDIVPQMYSDVRYGVREGAKPRRSMVDLAAAVRAVVMKVDALSQISMQI